MFFFFVYILKVSGISTTGGHLEILSGHPDILQEGVMGVVVKYLRMYIQSFSCVYLRASTIPKDLKCSTSANLHSNKLMQQHFRKMTQRLQIKLAYEEKCELLITTIPTKSSGVAFALNYRERRRHYYII